MPAHPRPSPHADHCRCVARLLPLDACCSELCGARNGRAHLAQPVACAVSRDPSAGLVADAAAGYQHRPGQAQPPARVCCAGPLCRPGRADVTPPAAVVVRRPARLRRIDGTAAGLHARSPGGVGRPAGRRAGHHHGGDARRMGTTRRAGRSGGARRSGLAGLRSRSRSCRNA